MGTDGSYPCGEYNIRNKSGESLGCIPDSLDHTPEMSRTLSTLLKKKKKEIEDSLSPKLCFIEDFMFGLIAFFGGKTPLSYGERK